MADSATVVPGGPGVYYLGWQTGRSVRRMVVETDEQGQGPCFEERGPHSPLETEADVVPLG